jgi:hypothetical protein
MSHDVVIGAEGPIGTGLCRIRYANFRECFFCEVRE